MSNVIHLPARDGHTIKIAWDSTLDGGWYVVVTPYGKYNHLAKTYRLLHEARGYASGLEMVHGWEIIKELGDELGGAA